MPPIPPTKPPRTSAEEMKYDIMIKALEHIINNNSGMYSILKHIATKAVLDVAKVK